MIYLPVSSASSSSPRRSKCLAGFVCFLRDMVTAGQPRALWHSSTGRQISDLVSTAQLVRMSQLWLSIMWLDYHNEIARRVLIGFDAAGGLLLRSCILQQWVRESERQCGCEMQRHNHNTIGCDARSRAASWPIASMKLCNTEPQSYLLHS